MSGIFSSSNFMWISVARLIKKVMIVNIFLDLDCKRNDFAAQMLQGPI